MDPSSSVALPPRRTLIPTALWLGLAVGLIEGMGWMVVQWTGRQTSLWKSVLWIAPIVDGVVLMVWALVLLLALRWVSSAKWWSWAPTLLAFAGSVILVALALQIFVHPAAQLLLAAGVAKVAGGWFAKRRDGVLDFTNRTLPHLAGLVIAMVVVVQGLLWYGEVRHVSNLPAPSAEAPNVVVVVIDALRADRMSSYGNTNLSSPFVDRLAEEGVLFEQAQAASPYTLPSHASLLSGLEINEHGVEWLTFKEFGKADYPSIAESMSDLGYRTGAFSANPFWFTREQGFGRGFAHFDDFYHSPADMAYRTVLGKAFERFIKARIGLVDVAGRKSAEKSTDLVLRWLERDTDPPFFAFVNYFDVHDPYLPPEPYRSAFWSGDEAPGGLLNWRHGRTSLDGSREEIDSELAAYDGSLAYVDSQIGRLVDEIEERWPDEELLVVITSDHGEAFGEHGTYLHGHSLYREEIHVPLVFWWPGQVPAGVRVARPVTHQSIPATVLDLVSGGTADTYGSPSVVPLWSDPSREADWRLPLAEMSQRDWLGAIFPTHHGDMKSLWGAEHEYIAHDTLPEELFSRGDLLQAEDLTDRTEMQSILDMFRAEMGRRAPGWTPAR